MVKPGISTACFYPQYTEESFLQISNSGVPYIEVFFNCHAELKSSFLRELRIVADNTGVQILSVHPYISGMDPLYFFSNYDRRFHEGIDIYKMHYEAANILGADIVVFHGALRHQQITVENYCERFYPIWAAGQQQGVRLCQENVSRCTSHSPEFFSKMYDLLPEAQYVLDLKQSIRAQFSPFEFVQAMADNIAHIHISDHNAHHDCMNLGTGVLNICEFLNAIKQNGFSGGVIVELYRDNFKDIVDIMLGYQHLCTAVSTVFQDD